MLIFSAEKFYWCGAKLREIESDCYLGSMGCFGGEPGIDLSRALDERGRNKALDGLPDVAPQFRELGLTIAADTTDELVEKLRGADFKCSFEWLFENVHAIEGIARKEMKGKLFLYVSPERARFWPTETAPNVFGDEVGDSFPSASPEIFNACTCLATGHPTAAVFHLMRVLEVGLSALGRVFGVSLEHTNWGPAIDQIESKVREMHKDNAWKALPDCKDLQSFYSQAASHFGVLKDAWRNYTMHGHNRYEQDEAERIFDNVKGFMQKLSKKITEV